MSDTYEEQNKSKAGEEDQKNQENFDETTKNINTYERKKSRNNSKYSQTEP
jgi:hypothetical protein